MLASRKLTKLRALIVLPTRDLVTQVRETFESIAKGRGLKVNNRNTLWQLTTLDNLSQIASTAGHHSFPHEQQTLVDTSAPKWDLSVPMKQRLTKPIVYVAGLPKSTFS